MSLLPILVPARDVSRLPGRLAALVAERLKRSGVDDRAIAAEVSAMSLVVVAPTASRSVLGIMVDFAKAVPYHLEPGRWGEETLRLVEERLAQAPCHAARSFDDVIVPERKAPELLNARWLANAPL